MSSTYHQAARYVHFTVHAPELPHSAINLASYILLDPHALSDLKDFLPDICINSRLSHCATCPTHLTLLIVIAITISLQVAHYNLIISSYNFLNPPFQVQIFCTEADPRFASKYRVFRQFTVIHIPSHIR